MAIRFNLGSTSRWLYGLLAGKKSQVVRQALSKASRAWYGSNNVAYNYTTHDGTKKQGYAPLMPYLVYKGLDQEDPKGPAAHLQKPGEKNESPGERYSSPLLGKNVDIIVGDSAVG